jgi:hypothetical protein
MRDPRPIEDMFDNQHKSRRTLMRLIVSVNTPILPRASVLTMSIHRYSATFLPFGFYLMIVKDFVVKMGENKKCLSGKLLSQKY